MAARSASDAAHLRLGLEQLLLQLRVVELEDHGVGGDLGAGPQHDALDPALRRRRQPAAGLVHRHQRAEAAHLAHHRAALDRVAPDGARLDGGRGGFQAGEEDRHQRHDDDGADRHVDAAHFLLAGDGCGSLNVHELESLLRRSARPNGWHPRPGLSQTSCHPLIRPTSLIQREFRPSGSVRSEAAVVRKWDESAGRGQVDTRTAARG